MYHIFIIFQQQHIVLNFHEFWSCTVNILIMEREIFSLKMRSPENTIIKFN